MPEDTYKTLLDSVAGGTKDPEPANTPPPAEPEPTTPVEPEPTPAPANEPKEPQKDEPEAPETPPTEPKKQEPNENARWAQMRVEKAKYEKAVKAAAEAEGLSVDEYLAKLETGALEKRASEMKVPPEFLRQMEETQAQLKELQNSQVRQRLAAEFTRVQTTFKLSDVELDTFVRTLGDQGFNFQNPNVDYEMLYRGMNYEKLLEKARQEWIAHSQQGTQAPKGATSNGKSSDNGGTRRVDTPEDLALILQEALKK